MIAGTELDDRSLIRARAASEGEAIKPIVKSALLGSAILLGMSLSACDSKKENAEEKQADAVRASADATADALKATADKKDPVTDGVDSPAENAQESKATAIREAGDAKADAMENKADKRDKAPE
ncbi:hypothetical protein [Novosphingobium sp. G106]|uniref:hypothetical protein n=1 Tax=Novosphingobium sp. G106 TaxID=2849500 RepID=UPI0028115939|nr:hypothetical protein [Novosphingobium sp. G106]